MTEIDLTALLNDLSILEQQLIKTSQNILQLKEANKQYIQFFLSYFLFMIMNFFLKKKKNAEIQLQQFVLSFYLVKDLELKMVQKLISRKKKSKT